MLPAATWLTAAALVTPLAIAAVGTAPSVADGQPFPLTSASTSSSPSSSPSQTPTVTATAPPTTPAPSPTVVIPTTPAPSPTVVIPTTPAPTTEPADPFLAMETSLAALGLPTGKVDGKVTRKTRRALCAYRDLNGKRATRKPATKRLAAEVTGSTEIPVLPRKLQGVKALVSLTCQTTYVANNLRVVKKVLPVSTGKDNGYHATRTGFKRVYYKVNAWQRSTLFPEPDGRPGLYRPIYFDRGIAFHGVRKPIRTRPQSHGCVRTWPKQQDWLFKRLRVRDRVFVYGNYWKGRSAPLGGYGR